MHVALSLWEPAVSSLCAYSSLFISMKFDQSRDRKFSHVLGSREDAPCAPLPCDSTVEISSVCLPVCCVLQGWWTPAQQENPGLCPLLSATKEKRLSENQWWNISSLIWRTSVKFASKKGYHRSLWKSVCLKGSVPSLAGAPAWWQSKFRGFGMVSLHWMRLCMKL